jgi:hypothetical protein
MVTLMLAGFAAAWLVGFTLYLGDSRWFLVAWFAILLWNAYSWVYRTAYGAAISQFTLRWRGIGRSGEIPLGDITDVRLPRVGTGLIVIEHRNGNLVLGVGQGCEAFLDQLARARPGLPIRVGRPVRRSGGSFYRLANWWHPEESAAQL